MQVLAAMQHTCSGIIAAEAVLAIRPGRPRPTQTRSWPTQTARVIPMYTTSVGLPNIRLAFDWPTQMKIPRTAPALQEQSHHVFTISMRL